MLQFFESFDGPTATTYYLNDGGSGAVAEKLTSGSTVVWHDYVSAGSGIVAERFDTAGTVSWRYFVLDHLGSTAALTDASGTVTERLAYDGPSLALRAFVARNAPPERCVRSAEA